MGTVHWGVDWGWKSWEINTDSMKMTPKERILCALNLEEPDRVPYCEATIDPVVAAKLLGREPPRELVEVGTVRRPVEEDKALSQLLHRDNITCRLTAPIFAEKLRSWIFPIPTTIVCMPKPRNMQGRRMSLRSSFQPDWESPLPI
jgi:hypothetical protein